MDGVSYLSIQDDPEHWADEVLRLAEKWKKRDRGDFRAVTECGFDINSQVEKLQDYYLHLCSCD